MLLARHWHRVTGIVVVSNMTSPSNSRSVTWPAGQEPPVEFRPVEVLVPFQQPLSDSMPGVGIEITDGCWDTPWRKYPAPARSAQTDDIPF